MYVPPHFAQTDREQLFAFMERHSFALVVSPAAGSIIGSHVPLLLEREAGEFGTLVGHFANANGHSSAAAGETLVVFSGPHAYVSPAWYRAENMVPTWNYVAVHAYGTLEFFRDPDRIVDSLAKLAERNELSQPVPWTFDPQSEFIRKLAAQVIGFRLKISRLEGKWKLNQNHPAARGELVIEQLASRANENSQAVARLMRELGGGG